MTVQERAEAYKKADDAFKKGDELQNIQLNVRNGGYNEIPVLKLLDDIRECLEGFDELIEAFEKLKPSINNVHSKSLDNFLEEAISVIMDVYQKYEDAYAASDKTKLKKIEAWLDEHDSSDDYSEEDGYTL